MLAHVTLSLALGLTRASDYLASAAVALAEPYLGDCYAGGGDLAFYDDPHDEVGAPTCYYLREIGVREAVKRVS